MNILLEGHVCLLRCFITTTNFINFIKFGGGGGQRFLYMKHCQVNYAVYRPSIWQHLLHLKSATELYVFFKMGHTKIGMLE
jgi:hypothetical protein